MWQHWKQWQTILGGSKITADGDCSHEIKRHLLLGRKVMTNHLDSILKSRVSEWVKSLSRVWLFVILWTVAYQAPPSMGFSRQEYWSGLLVPSPGDLSNPGIEPRSPALQADALTSEPPGKPKKQRHDFTNKGPSSQSYVLSSSHVWMWEWTIRKAECRNIDAFERWYWRRLLRVPQPARRSNQSILKEISPEYSLEGLMLKLKLQYLAIWCGELTHLKRPWCWERLKAGKKGMTEDEMVGWLHQLNGDEFE